MDSEGRECLLIESELNKQRINISDRCALRQTKKLIEKSEKRKILAQTERSSKN